MEDIGKRPWGALSAMLALAALRVLAGQPASFGDAPSAQAMRTRGASVTCSTESSGNLNPTNDAAHDTCTVLGKAPSGWIAKSSLPPRRKGKNVRAGGSIAYVDSCWDTALTADSRDLSGPAKDGRYPVLRGYVYALKGNGTYEFYRYSIADNVWTTMESLPAHNRAGQKRSVKNGGTLVVGPDHKLYATKGNNTLDFWAYNPDGPEGRRWTQKADVPVGRKKIRGGASAIGVAANSIYLLKGSGTTEFYRYSIADDFWETMAPAPLGKSGRSFKSGSCVTSGGAGTIYALKADCNEFFAYDAGLNVWNERSEVPFVGNSGRARKVGNGAGLAWTDRGIYCLKGRNTLEFWIYFPDSEMWVQKEGVPFAGTKNVRSGGAITAAGGSLFALKGNNTLEFYQYIPDSGSSGLGEHSFTPVATRPIRTAPNPFSELTRISYSLPRAGNVSLRLYDVTGALASTLVSGYQLAGAHVVSLRADRARGRKTTEGNLAAGIYLLQLEAKDYSTTQKLMLE